MTNSFIPPTDQSQAPNAEMTTVIDTATGDQWRVPTRAVEAIIAALAGDTARPGLDVEALGQAYIRVRGAHNPTAEELDGDEEVWPCAWCRLAVEQHIAAARLTEDRP